MNEPIEPALTPEEWAEIAPGDGLWDRWEAVWQDEFGAHAPEHAMAALCLHGQPFGFTHEDVRKLRDMPDGTGYASIDDPEWFASLLDRVRALLPPE